ncbi:MAG: TonB-dependent receptor [Nitrospira sp.]|nr:TonB-dependent receptor [Nitrospira sp.]
MQQLVIGLGLLFVVVSGAGVGHAEEEVPVVQTEEVVTSATKTELPLSHVTSAVEVITGKEMEQKKLKTVMDALRLAQGVAAFSNGGPGTQAQVRIRGGTANQTMVVIDGTIVNSPTDGAFNFANLTAENIERVEILRGAQSMLWGSDAMGGVINIITKKGTGAPTASSFLEYGSFATIREGAQASGAKGLVDYAVSFSRWDTSNFSAANYRRGATERDGYHNWQASSKLGVALPKDGRLEFTLRWWNANVGIDGNTTTTPRETLGAINKTNSVILSGSYYQPITSWWSQKLTLAQGNDLARSWGGTVTKNLNTGVTTTSAQSLSDIQYLNKRIEWQHNFQVADPLLVTAGYQFREDQGYNASNFTGGAPTRLLSTNAGFAEAQLNLKDRYLMTAGVRHDSYNVFGEKTTYRVTGGYLLPETGTKLRGSYSTGFRAPTLNQLFYTSSSFNGNPNLKPEKNQSMDIGLDQRLFKDKLMLSGGYFWTHYADLITTATTTFEQVSQAKSQGVEAGFKLELLKGLDAKGQYTYTLTRDFSTARRLSRWPIHQGTVGLSYQPVQPVHINLDYRYVGSRFNNTAPTTTVLQKQGSFGVVNVAATYDVTKSWQIYARVDNLFDQQYEEILFYGTPIRSIYGGIKLTY